MGEIGPRFGTVRELSSGLFEPRYVGADGVRHAVLFRESAGRVSVWEFMRLAARGGTARA